MTPSNPDLSLEHTLAGGGVRASGFANRRLSRITRLGFGVTKVDQGSTESHPTEKSNDSPRLVGVCVQKIPKNNLFLLLFL
jgi:hypothetical protein